MTQQEIQFFWPLTEQIPLALDFKPCEEYLERKRKEASYTGYRIDQWGENGKYLITSGSTSSWVTPHIIVDTENVTFQTKEKPSFLRSMLYKAMGIKLEKKLE